MNLEKLQSLGAFVSPATFEPADFEWTPEGEEKAVKFEVIVKTEPSPADFEFIQFHGLGAEDNSLMARRVHRMVRLVKIDGEEVGPDGLIPLENALQLKTDLLLSFIAAINKVAAAAGKPSKPAKAQKSSARPKSSGTN